MADIKIAGIMRAGAFSPNHIGNDAAIFNIVAEQLRKRGCEMKIYSEEQFATTPIGENIILNMCRERRSIELLQKLEDDGALVINSGYGIENCTRERMTRILLGSNIPYPESLIVDTDEAILDRLAAAHMEQCWIKRGEAHSMHKEDVSYCRHPEEAQEVLQEYFLRGIGRAVVSKHVSGDLVKFYGVQGQPFFYWFCPFVANGGTYGCSALNEGGPDAVKAMGLQLKKMCLHAAEELNVSIYGGDAVILPDGSASIISFNDWPSFASCRTEAASHIAKSVLASIKDYRR